MINLSLIFVYYFVSSAFGQSILSPSCPGNIYFERVQPDGYYPPLDAWRGVINVRASNIPVVLRIQVVYTTVREVKESHGGSALRGRAFYRCWKRLLSCRRQKNYLRWGIHYHFGMEGNSLKLELAESKESIQQRYTSGTLREMKYYLHIPPGLPIPQVTRLQVDDSVICSAIPERGSLVFTVNLEHRLFQTKEEPSISNVIFGEQPSLVKVPSVEIVPISGVLPNEPIHPPGPGRIPSLPGNVFPYFTQPPFQLPIFEGEEWQATCGVQLNKNPLIAGGTIAIYGKWPWLVPLFQKTSKAEMNFICGSVLLSKQFLITAAHCIKPNCRQVDARSVIAFVGLFDLNAAGGEDSPSLVSEIIIHPDFNCTSFYSDIALLRLQTPVTMTQHLNPACLWRGNSDLRNIVGRHGTVVGWGSNGRDRTRSNIPNMISMPIVSWEECLQSNSHFLSFYSNSTFCAGWRNGRGPCNGDSGGGFMLPIKERNGQTRWYLRGIVSLSLNKEDGNGGTCDLDQYIVFADVGMFVDWISTIITDN